MMAAFINGLRINELYHKLAKKPSRTLEELLNKAQAIANAKEAARLKRKSKRDIEDRQKKNESVDPKDG